MKQIRVKPTHVWATESKGANGADVAKDQRDEQGKEGDSNLGMLRKPMQRKLDENRLPFRRTAVKDSGWCSAML